jgi:hypothetical protein
LAARYRIACDVRVLPDTNARKCFASGLAGGAFAGEVFDGALVVAGLGDGDGVDGSVDASVAAAVEPVSFVPAGGGVEGCRAVA